MKNAALVMWEREQELKCAAMSGAVKATAAILLLLAIVGCAPLSMSQATYGDYVKAGAGQGEFEQMKFNCLNEAARAVPPSYQLVQTPAQMVNNRQCDKHNQNCTFTAAYAPATAYSVDANTGMREQAVKACFGRNGWVQAE